MTIEEMKTNVIHTYGFEHSATIYFFDICELMPDDLWNIEVAYHFAMGCKWPEDEDEEEEEG